MADTTDVAQPTDDSVTPPSARPSYQSSRLNRALAWVGVVAGGLFIVAAIFLSGFFLDWSEHAHMQMGMGRMPAAHAAKDCCADMKPGEMNPGAMGPNTMDPKSGR